MRARAVSAWSLRRVRSETRSLSATSAVVSSRAVSTGAVTAASSAAR